MKLKLDETIKSPLKSDVQDPKAQSFKPQHSAMGNDKNLILNMDVTQIYLHLTARHMYGQSYWWQVNIRGKFKGHFSFIPGGKK